MHLPINCAGVSDTPRNSLEAAALLNPGNNLLPFRLEPISCSRAMAFSGLTPREGPRRINAREITPAAGEATLFEAAAARHLT